MGDLKKKKSTYDERECAIRQSPSSINEPTIERLRAYLKEFYKIQKEKKEQEEE